MKIIRAEMWGIHLPLKEPFVVSYARFESMPSIILKLTTDTGLEGYGEAVPDEHVTGESFYGAYALLEKVLMPEVMGQSPFQIEEIHGRMNAALKGNPSIKAAVDIACYDLMGKAVGLPVYNLIGGRAHEKLGYPKVISIGEPSKMSEAALDALENGYEHLKIKLSGDAALDVQRLKEIRLAVGESVPIRVDVNQGWGTYETAKRALAQTESLKLDWVEQPLVPEAFKEMNELRQSTTTALMLDESICTEKDLQCAIETRSADKINLKLMKSGGIYPIIHMAKTAEAAGLACQIGSMVESSIGSAAGYHAAMARKNIETTELTGPLLFSKDPGNLQYEIPYVHLGEKSGLGVDVDEAVLEELSEMQSVLEE
ncbi:mandelate racemase/muconate lactonizing enzyme family protein [Jeotgalibacillus salarius]|uniref:Dipeptide epimerase n=1 Tax=Jeotgalibacillus salarius TaxID=546023 RepID=A0A4Y8LLQ2_9BACL|nr:dipeptide epimerase [Jeotgalibacillus salarius]TFE03968.1 dipeptide epimerase [Jeotgalibacillus salarius]